MSGNRAAIRYAKATLEHAIEEKADAAVNADMEQIAATIAGSAELRLVLEGPVIKAEDKNNALLEIFSGANGITKGLIQTLLGNKRISLLQEVALKYSDLYRELKGERRAIVTTAVPLSGDLEKKILETVTRATGNQVSLENRVDPDIIGGFVLRIGDTRYDASIASKLNGLKREFTKSL
jgi:F-type H+-transporting ATPase subunit delta